MDGLVLKEFFLNKERMTIGRKPHNDIQIDNLAVSGDHAVIITMQDDAFIEDLGSTNGTLVNGQPISKHFLQHEEKDLVLNVKQNLIAHQTLFAPNVATKVLELMIG